MGYIAIDLGSTHVKAAWVVPETARISDVRTQRFPAPRDRTGRRFEVDLGAILEVVLDLVEGYVTKYGARASGLLISTQTHGFVLLDGDGAPRSGYISWQDERCLELSQTTDRTHLAELEERLDPELFRPSGVAVKPSLALSNLVAWLAQGTTPAHRLRLCTLGSYVTARLTGTHACHVTNAAATGLVHVPDGTWNEPLIEDLGLGGMLLPELRHETSPCGYYETQGVRLAVFPDVGDHHATVLGSLSRVAHDVNINVGTAAQVTRISTDFERGHHEVRPFFDGTFLHVVTGVPGGRNLDVLLGLLVDAADVLGYPVHDTGLLWEQVAQLAQDVREPQLDVQTGFFPGTTGVAEGAIRNIDADNLTVAQLFAGAFRNLAALFAHYVAVFDRAGGVERVVLSGSVLRRNSALRAEIERALPQPTVLSPVELDVFAGLLRIAMVIDGHTRSIGDSAVEISAASGLGTGRD